MNPYTFRGWHLPAAYESSACDRNYPAMYPATWTSSYFSPSYPFQTDSAAAASAVAAKNSSASNDWKLQGICSPTPDANGGLSTRSSSENGLVSTNGKGGYDGLKGGYEGLKGGYESLKSGYEGLLYKPNVSGGRSGLGGSDYEGAAAAAREEAAQRSCCAISCTCSSSTPCAVAQGSRLNGMLDGSCGGGAWRTAADMSPVGHLDFKPNVGPAQISAYQSHNYCS